MSSPPNAMKVLHLLGELRPSGAEVMMALAAPLWRKLGCDLHILSIAKTRGQHADVLERAGWTIHLWASDAGRLGMIGELTEKIREMAPDVVHLHLEGRNLPITIAVWRCGIPMVRTVHNNFLFGGFLRFQKMLERMICRMLGSRHIAISASVQHNERKRFSNPTTLCWNWFDATRFRPPTALEKQKAKERLGLPRDRKILVSVGNGSDVKNYAAIIEALARHPDASLVYYQVGNPHPEGKDESLVRQHHLEDRVHFCGPRHDVHDWLWASDLYVMPSLYEGFSIAAVEAIAAGCNCLFAQNPGLSDLMDFGIEAYWAQSTAISMLNAILRWQNRPLADADLRQNAAIVRQEFSVDRRASDYFTLWEQTVHSSID